MYYLSFLPRIQEHDGIKSNRERSRMRNGGGCSQPLRDWGVAATRAC